MTGLYIAFRTPIINDRSVPTAMVVLKFNNKNRIGIISEPPPTPVKPITKPILKPAIV